MGKKALVKLFVGCNPGYVRTDSHRPHTLEMKHHVESSPHRH